MARPFLMTWNWSDLVHAEVDWKAGTIKRKRSKNQEREIAPTVTWFLWPITLDLLKKHQNTDQSLTNEEGEVRLLVTAKDGPFVPEGLDGQRLTRSDNIRSAYRRLCSRVKIPKEEQIPLKCIRKTSATLLDDHDVFGRFISYFIGNSPRGGTDTHYKVPSPSQMKKLREWLGQRYGMRKFQNR